MARVAHAHQEHEGEDLVEAARHTLTDSGEQWTGMRQSVFEELARHEKPASAYDIADNLSQSRGKRVAPNSVYRILDLFVRTNLAKRIESANAYLVNTPRLHFPDLRRLRQGSAYRRRPRDRCAAHRG